MICSSFSYLAKYSIMSVVEASSSSIANDSTGSGSSNVVQRGNISSFASTTATTNLTTIDTNGNVFKVPDYSIKDILQAIPKHCYERSLIRSLGYVVRDITMMVLISYVGHSFIPLVDIENHETLSTVVRGSLWMVQSYLIGLFGFGLWILAHECGHGAFSDYQNLNDLIGWVIHSYLMVPYFSWKFSHAKHHKATGHLTKDMVFIPYTKEEYLEKNKVEKVSELVEESPIYSLLVLIFQQLGGLQLYLANNATGQVYPGVSWYARSHYSPISPVFDKNQYWFIVLSDIGIISTLTVVYQWYKNFGLFNMMINWFVPWLWVNHWLVFVTFYNILIQQCLIMLLTNGLLLVVLLLQLIEILDLLVNTSSMILLKLMFYIIMFQEFHFIMPEKLLKLLKSYGWTL